ncbi:MAG: hypothetical protein DMG13_20395 [Acidobacteria bacterium]|nr:MAG: hypothetical protein DMG13_20395 [Acidobacteriota bacterium]
MGWRFRKYFGGRGFRWVISKRGVGVGWGIPGLRFGISPLGQPYISVSLPGTGLYWIKYFGRQKQPPSTLRSKPSQPPPVHPLPPSNTRPRTNTQPWWKQGP